MSRGGENGNLRNPAIEYGPGWLYAEYNISWFKSHAIMYDGPSQYIIEKLWQK